MIERLTGGERQIALMICFVMAIVGLVMAAAGHGDPMGSHGAIVLIAAGIMTFFVLRPFSSVQLRSALPSTVW